jgi:hypothetical protein
MGTRSQAQRVNSRASLHKRRREDEIEVAQEELRNLQSSLVKISTSISNRNVELKDAHREYLRLLKVEGRRATALGLYERFRALHADLASDANANEGQPPDTDVETLLTLADRIDPDLQQLARKLEPKEEDTSEDWKEEIVATEKLLGAAKEEEQGFMKAIEEKKQLISKLKAELGYDQTEKRQRSA